MEDGWIKMFRRFLEWEWYSDTNMVRLFLHLLLKANFEDKRWRGMEVKRGQVVTSLETLKSEIRLSTRTLRTCLERLEKTGEIDKQTTSQFSIITICKYGDYQQVQEVLRQTNDKPTTSKRQQHKNIRNKERKNNIPPNPLQGESSQEPEVVVEVEPNDFVDPAFAQAFETWLQYKHEKRQTYKSKQSLKACYNKLVKLSHGDPQIAMAIVEQSMANNWAGLFELKQDYNGATTINQSGYIDRRQAEREQLARGYAETIARRLAEDDARKGTVRRQDEVPY